MSVLVASVSLTAKLFIDYHLIRWTLQLISCRWSLTSAQSPHFSSLDVDVQSNCVDGFIIIIIMNSVSITFYGLSQCFIVVVSADDDDDINTFHVQMISMIEWKIVNSSTKDVHRLAEEVSAVAKICLLRCWLFVELRSHFFFFIRPPPFIIIIIFNVSIITAISSLLSWSKKTKKKNIRNADSTLTKKTTPEEHSFVFHDDRSSSFIFLIHFKCSKFFINHFILIFPTRNDWKTIKFNYKSIFKSNRYVLPNRFDECNRFQLNVITHTIDISTVKIINVRLMRAFQYAVPSAGDLIWSQLKWYCFCFGVGFRRLLDCNHTVNVFTLSASTAICGHAHLISNNATAFLGAKDRSESFSILLIKKSIQNRINTWIGSSKPLSDWRKIG